MVRRTPSTALFVFTVVASSSALRAGSPSAPVEISPDRYQADVKFLASPQLKGRGTGTPGLEKAADYIAREFKKAGLQPVAGTAWFQKFNVSTNVKLGARNKVLWHDQTSSAASRSVPVKMKDEFIPLNLSGSANLSGKLVFAGYGISAREYQYDDYAGIDAKDKIVVLLRHEPQEFDGKSVFDGRVYTSHAQLAVKAANAKLHGAKAVVFVNDTNAHGSEDNLEKFVSTVGPSSFGIPFIQIRADVVEKWFEIAGRSFKTVQEQIDKDLKPQSFAFPDRLTLEMDVDVRRQVREVRNVVGFLPGESDEYIVIGAHYDHLGLGEQFSMAPSEAGKPHPGADDNASGTAGLLELARYFGSRPKPKRGIVFLAFAGEELGLLGSSYYVANPLKPLDKAVAMINMDMIGRVREGRVFVGGSGTGTTFKKLLEEVRGQHDGFKLDVSEQGGYGSSDHTSFTTRQVPVLFFFSGLHGDYHKPSDTWDKIDNVNAAKLVALIAGVATRLGDGSDRPQYVKVTPPASAHASGSGSSGGSGGYGPYFGSIPDFAEPPTGVRFADVREGSPAAKAGLRRGDIMVGFDGKKVGNLYDFTLLLRSKKPGDEVMVEILRDNQPMSIKVTLEARR